MSIEICIFRMQKRALDYMLYPGEICTKQYPENNLGLYYKTITLSEFRIKGACQVYRWIDKYEVHRYFLQKI